jgi:hypothetical protein
MNAPRTIRTTVKHTQTGAYIEHFEGMKDDRGRALGMSVRLGTAVSTVAEPDGGVIQPGSIHNPLPGDYFVATCTTTRNGREYGATTDWKFFRTQGERQRYISKRIADARKRYARFQAA